MISPISSLANMEMALYGGLGMNATAPSYLNSYRGSFNDSIFNKTPYSYGNYGFYGNSYNPTFGQQVTNSYKTETQQTNLPTKGLTEKEQEALINYYAKGLTPSESLLACASTNALFSATMHPRLLAHPINTISTLNKVDKMFRPIKDTNSALNKLWTNKETNNLVREAYFQMHKAAARCEKKLGWFRRSYRTNPENLKAIEGLMKEMEVALSHGNESKIREITAKLQHSYVNDGWINRGWNGVKNFITGGDSKVATVTEKLHDSKGIAEKVNKLQKTTLTFKDALKQGGGVKGGGFFMGIEFLMAIFDGRFTKAFAKDKENEAKGIKSNLGWTQVGQTAVKAAGNAVGWALGEAAGIWAFTKAGAAIGTAFGPGVGTIIGGIVGFVGGGIGMWLAGKATKALVGDDVVNKIDAENLAKTTEGQTQLLQYTIEQAQSGKKVPPEVQQAATKLIYQYA